MSELTAQFWFSLTGTYYDYAPVCSSHFFLISMRHLALTAPRFAPSCASWTAGHRPRERCAAPFLTQLVVLTLTRPNLLMYRPTTILLSGPLLPW